MASAGLPTTHSGKHGAVLQEVSAGAKPSEVVAAVIAGAQASRTSSNANRGIQFAFLFILVFAVTVYFREELWSISRDVSKHPIMGYVEQLQISHYLGSKWLFGSGKDMTAEQLEVAQEITGQAGSNPAAPTASAGSGNSTAATTTTTAAASAPSGTTQQQQQPAAGATQAAAAAQPGGAAAAEPAKAAQAAASGGGGAGSAPAGAAAGAATRRSWARRLLTVHRSKCDSSNAKMLMRRLLVLAQRRVRG